VPVFVIGLVTLITPETPAEPAEPAGIPKLKIAELDVPVLVTVGVAVEAKTVAEPAVIVAADPLVPLAPGMPCKPTVAVVTVTGVSVTATLTSCSVTVTLVVDSVTLTTTSLI
jgi:hypothetical protein